LYGNRLSCDCHLDWLQAVNDESQRQLLPTVPDLEDLACSNHGGVRVVDLPPDRVLCPYETHCFDLCMCCDFYACDCRMQCPYGCECEHDLSWSRNIVSCSDRNHTHIPVLIPMDATDVRLDGNRLHYIDQQNFLGRHRVQRLYLNSSSVVRLGAATFTGLSDLRTLHLEDNKLGELRGDEFAGLARLRELYLQHNAITAISEQAFEPLISLQVLRLDGNLLTSYQVWKYVAGHQLLASISLAENLWSCSCDFVSPFNAFLERRKDLVADYDNVICVTNHGGLKSGEPCSARKFISKAGKDGEADKDDNLALATILVPSTLAVVMILVGFLAVCVFRKSIDSWIYGKTSEIYESSNNTRLPNTVYNNNSSNSSSAETDPTMYDIFVSYAVQDSDLVAGPLAQVLDSGRVFYQHADWPRGAPLEETVALLSSASSRVTVVLSEFYVHSEMAALRTILSVNESNKSKVALLLLNQTGNQLMSRQPDLCRLLGGYPIIQWGSPGFFDSLRYFLLSSPYLTLQRNAAASFQNVHLATNGFQEAEAVQPRFVQPPKPAPEIRHAHEAPELRPKPGCQRLNGKTAQGLGFVLRLDPSALLPGAALSLPGPDLPFPAVCHVYTQSTSSGQQLLEATEAEEYLV
jgi:hypothetical protein